MDTIEYIRRHIQGMRMQASATLSGITDEQLNWAPPGTANAIGVTLLHVVGGEDLFIQRWLLGKATLWDSQGWSERIGLAMPPGGGGGWEEAKKASLKAAPLMAYQEAVCAATEEYLASIQPEELDRKIPLFGSERPVAEVLMMLINHFTGHMGEIAAIKGIQGLKGLPF